MSNSLIRKLLLCIFCETHCCMALQTDTPQCYNIYIIACCSLPGHKMKKKIEKYCCYVMLTLSTVEFVSSHISPTKHKTYLLKTSLIMQTRTEENPWKYFQILQSYCCSPATFLPSMSHLCKGTGVDKKTSSLPRSRGITSPVQ